MRSEQVFRATEQIGNRYVLCRVAARTTRRLHFASSSTQDAIQDAFVRMCAAPEPREAAAIELPEAMYESEPVLPVSCTG